MCDLQEAIQSEIKLESTYGYTHADILNHRLRLATHNAGENARKTHGPVHCIH